MDMPSKLSVKGRLLNGVAVAVFAQARIRIAVNVADTETVTIGDDVYEFDRAEGGVVAGNIAVIGHADDTPANASNALVATINASGTEPVRAVDIGVNDILLLCTVASGYAAACAETMGGAGNEIDAAFYGGFASATAPIVVFDVVPSALEVSAGSLVLPVDFVANGAMVIAVVSATGVPFAYDGAVDVDATNKTVTLDNSGVADFAVTHTLQVLVY